MMNYKLAAAEQITTTIEANMTDLIDKLCEGETQELKNLVWWLLARRMCACNVCGSCFALPSLEEC